MPPTMAEQSASANTDAVSQGRRVAHITTVHSAADARICYREAQVLVEMGYRVTVFGRHSRDTEIGGVSIRGLGQSRGRIRRILTSWWRALRIVRQHEADIYHFHDFELLPTVVLAKWLYGKRVVYDAHEDVSLVAMKDWLPRWIRRPLAAAVRWLTGFAARRADGIVVPTRLLEEQFRKWSPRVATFVNYPAPHFLSCRDRDWVPWDRRDNEVIHLGTLSMRRLDFMVRLAAEFLRHRPGWSWTLLGMHDEMLEWFEANVPADVRDRLHGVGKVPHEEIAGRLCRARLGVNYHPLDTRQLAVAIPVKAFEYLACGLPMVTTRVPMLVELVDSCPAVALADESSDAYLDAVLALADREDLGSLSDDARRFSDERFNCRREGERLAALYNDICEAKAD